MSKTAPLPSAALPRAPHAIWQFAKVVLQVGLLSSIWVAMDVLRQHFGWSMPAGLIGFGLLAVGLFSGLVKVQWLQGGTHWLLAEMLLFFVPAMLVVIVASTACVMAATALAVDRVYRFELWLARRKSSRDGATQGQE